MGKQEPSRETMLMLGFINLHSTSGLFAVTYMISWVSITGAENITCVVGADDAGRGLEIIGPNISRSSFNVFAVDALPFATSTSAGVSKCEEKN